MGQQVSKDIRSRLEHCTLEELLIDDEYVKELERHLLRLPKKSHNNLAKILVSWENTLSKDSNPGSQSNPPPKGGNSSPKDRNSRIYKLSSLWSIQSKDISIPQSVAEALKQDHRNLLRQSSKNGVGLQPADYYEYTCNVETGRTLDKILWRFLTTFYYDFISELDATKQRLSTTENSGVTFVVAVICRSGKHDPDTVREKVIGWVKVGRRYRGFIDALCSGCLILFPEKISDLVWEQYVPIKGDMFTKVIQFLRDLGIVYKCEKEGWNDLSDKILQTLREPFRSLIPLQFQPSQIGWAGDADIHTHDNPPSSGTLDSRALPRLPPNRVIKARRKRTSVRRQLQSFARALTAHQTSLPLIVRQSHHSSGAHRSETQHETHGRSPQDRFPQAPTQCWASAPNDPGQWHLATNHQDDRLLSSPVSINYRGRDPLSDIPLNATNVYPSGTDSAPYMQDVDSSPGSHPRFVSPPGSQVHGHCYVDQRQKTGESISDTLRLERTGISNISALLNHDNNTPATPATTQGSLQSSKDGRTELVSGVTGQQCLDTAAACDTQTEPYFDSVSIPQQVDAASAAVVPTLLKAIQIEKHTLQQIVLERPNDILGSIWFGSPQGYPPSVSLRLSRALDIIVKASGQEVYVPGPPPGASSTVTGVHLIKLGVFGQMIQRDGFGEIVWNECGEEAYVTIVVVDERLEADFLRGAVSD